MNVLKDLLDKLQKELGYLKTAGLGSGAGDAGTTINGDVIMEITNKIQIRIDDINKKLGNIQRNAGNTTTLQDTPKGIDESRLIDLENKLDNHLQDYDNFKNEVINMLKQLQDQLNDKVDFSRLAELEKLLMDKLNEVVRQLTKQLADKAETKKNLKMLEKQLRNLIDIFAQKQSNPDEDNAMFSKKPLGGISCASCEKNLINLQQKPSEFYNWNRFPVRDPSERIARVGQGFSRMLSSMKPENVQKFHGQSVKQQHFYDDGSMVDNSAAPRTMQNFYQEQQDYKA